MTTVDLTWHEFAYACHVGCRRQLRALKRKREHAHGEPTERGPWDVHICAAASELAVAKQEGIYWVDDPELDYEGDVGPYHVRSTDLERGSLLLYPKDPDDGIFILAITKWLPRVVLPGFILARDGKRAEFWDTEKLRDPAFMVPQRVLTPYQLLTLKEAA